MLVLLAVASVPLTASAQGIIIFSKPADVPTEKKEADVPTMTHHASDFNAPKQIFNSSPEDLPMLAPAPANNNNASVRDALDKRKNWTLLTPEQILGIPTAEQILGLPEKDSDKNLTLEQKFLNRQSRPAAVAADGGRAGEPMRWNPAAAANPFVLKSKADGDNPSGPTAEKLEPGTKFFNPFVSGSGQASRPDDNSGSAWTSDFARPSRPKPSPEQQAEMESFRALMQPNPVPGQTPVATRFNVPPAPAPDPFLQARPVGNPVGLDVSPLGKLFSEPTGILPLPAVSTPPPTPINVRPKWQAQPPPWLTPGPPAPKPGWTY